MSGVFKKKKTIKVFDASGQNMTLWLEDESFFSTSAAILSFQPQIYCHLI